MTTSPAAAWFQRNTHQFDEFPIARLQAVKGDTCVSLVVPARNEAATVGDVVTRVREALLDTAGLVDEIVVIDSDSTDATAAIAADAGATVHAAREIRPDLGSVPGKGEAMWKSLFVTRGELIVFMDADLTDWDTHFVPGLLGPLLTRPEVALVKGYYERPGQDGPLDGGRVTELVARPVIALEHPELAGLVQPLAGEWAIRRSLFEQLNVPTGYAVEIASLVDTARLLGVDAIAQVGLGVRAHSHQPLLDLGAMATQLLAAVHRRRGLDRLDHRSELDHRDLPATPATSAAPDDDLQQSVVLRQYRPREGRIEPAERVVRVGERPPARSVE